MFIANTDVHEHSCFISVIIAVIYTASAENVCRLITSTN